jgi:hypothetical protein
MFRVYLETSLFSECCTIRTSEIARGRRATSLDWWHHQSDKFECLISAEVVRELSSEAFPEAAREPALGMLPGLPLVELSSDVIGLANILVTGRVMPSPANEGDAIHFAAAVVHRVDYLLTSNQKHLANPNKRTHLQVVCARLGYLVPEIVTPDLLILES